MPTNLLLLPLLGGYWFVHRCFYFHFRAQRNDGYRLLLEAAMAGLIFAAVARLFIVAFRFTPWSVKGVALWREFLPIPYSGTATGAVFVALVAPFIGNLIWSEEEAKDRLLGHHGNALFRLLHKAVKGSLPVAISLDTRKWYVGYVLESPNLDPAEQYFSLIPILSGYRDPTTLQVRDTVLYAPVYQDNDKNNFAITIALSAVKSANLFDQAVYEQFFDEKAGIKNEAGNQ